MAFKFEKLDVWQEAMDLGEEIYLMTRNFPKEEIYNLTSQLVRAVDSIALNIAEGASGQMDGEFNRFLGYSMRSIAEVVACLHKAKRRKYIDDETFNVKYNACETLFKRVASLKNAIQK